MNAHTYKPPGTDAVSVSKIHAPCLTGCTVRWRTDTDADCRHYEGEYVHPLGFVGLRMYESYNSVEDKIEAGGDYCFIWRGQTVWGTVFRYLSPKGLARLAKKHLEALHADD